MTGPHRLWLLLALAAPTPLAACGSDEKPPEANKAEVQTKPAKAAPKVPRTFDRDGVLARAEVEVFDSPLPADSVTLTSGKRWAGYQNRHGFWEVVRFYEKNLGNRYKTEHMRGGAKLTPKKGNGPEIYIPKPGKAGKSTRVYYFGQADDLPPPPIVENPKAKPVLANAPTSGGGRKGGVPNAPRSGTDKGGENYVQRTETRSDGSKVIVYSPNPVTNNPGRTSSNPRERGSSNKPSGGAVKINIPPGTQY